MIHVAVIVRVTQAELQNGPLLAGRSVAPRKLVGWFEIRRTGPVFPV